MIDRTRTLSAEYVRCLKKRGGTEVEVELPVIGPQFSLAISLPLGYSFNGLIMSNIKPI
jgi:hypothetical protein